MIEKIQKLLALTTSDNDHEALNAIRAANKIVNLGGKTWEEVFDHRVDKTAEDKYNKLVAEYNDLAQKFNVLLLAAALTVAHEQVKKKSFFNIF